MKEYSDLVFNILLNGEKREDRTGTGTISLFGERIKVDLRNGFPLLTTKKINWRSVAYELLWFLRGDGNVKYLNSNRVSIWDEWADEDGNLGPVYGVQWRSWKNGSLEIDQIGNVIESIKNDPFSRRHIVSSWNVGDLDLMNLPPCHGLVFQFYVSSNKEFLDCHVYQRSADVFLGVPFNIASYAMLCHMIGSLVELKPRNLVFSYGDVHLYNDHIDQAKKQLQRRERKLPRLRIINKKRNIDEYEYSDFEIVGYDPHPRIKANVSV